MRLLLIEDEPQFGQLLTKNLMKNHYVVDWCGNLQDAMHHLKTTEYDAILLDLGLPDGDGINVIKTASHLTPRPPIIITTGAGAVQDRIDGLNAGADDYVCKPFSLEELLARIAAVLRRPGKGLAVILRAGDLAFDSLTRSVTVGGVRIPMPRRELVMLELLIRRPGHVVTRGKMEDVVYNCGEEPVSNAIDANISRLRKRLKDHSSRVEIQSLRGLGYTLRDELA